MDKDDPEDRNKVTLMTVHSAKGLEYKYVYIVGLENLFPSQRAAESPDGMEEERRLFYVALTRAKVEATISYAEMRFKWGNMEFSRPELLPARDRPEICQGRLRYRHRRRPPAPLARRIRTFGHRRTAPPLRLPFPAETAGCGREQWRRPAGQQPRPRQFRRPPLRRRIRPRKAFRPGCGTRDARPQGRPDPARSSRPRAPRPTACAASVCGRRPTAAYPRRYDARQRRLYRGTARRAPPNSAWVSCSASRPSPPTTSWSWPSTARAKKTLLAKFAKLTKL